MSLRLASHISFMIVDDTLVPLADTRSISTSHVSLPNVYYIPNLTSSLVSVSQLCNFWYSILFSSTSYYVQDLQYSKVIGAGRRQGGCTFWMKCMFQNIVASSVELSSFHLNPSSSSFCLWLSRLGYISSPHLVRAGDGPQTSEWTKSKGAT